MATRTMATGQVVIEAQEALLAILKLADDGRADGSVSPMTALREIRLIALNAIPLAVLRSQG